MAKLQLLVGTEKGAFVLSSDEGRARWDVSQPIHKGWKVNDFQLDQRGATPTYWVAVGHYVYGPTVQRSRDMLKTWEPIENGPKFGEKATWTLNDIWSIVPGHPDEPDVLYAGVAEAGLFVSRDGGLNWEEMTSLTGHETRSAWEPGAGGMCCHTILLHPTNKERMWLGISAVGVFRSDDGGKTWVTKNKGLMSAAEPESKADVGSCVHRMVLDPRNPDRIYQQNHRGVVMSEDAGDSWRFIESGLPLNQTNTSFGFPIVVNPHAPDTLFVIPQESDEFRMMPDGQVAVYRSTNAGQSWEKKTNGLPGNHYSSVLRQAMTTDGLEENGVYFGTASGRIFYSIDNGDSWGEMPCQLPRISSVSAVILED